MAIDLAAYKNILSEIADKHVTLVAVSKFKPVEDIQALYDLGQKDFGENFVQELVLKYEALPKDIHWHFIGHLQTNKVKYIAPFIHLIHGVDKEKLLIEIDKQAAKQGRKIDCLLQLHIAEEETKFGFDESELAVIVGNINANKYPNVNIRGLMGMASFTNDAEKVKSEFKKLAGLARTTQTSIEGSDLLSMGMSGDYALAVAEGSNMIRIGSLLFGARQV